ncbi:hypothetical protein G9A89_015528 [Geosiphon pyriformis]|nr:hypothetical protein G9A89_015528 [Geosiphon pyriformis]
MLLAPLIKFEEEEKKPTWKVYQIFWADNNHNKLLPILDWGKKDKGKRKKNIPEKNQDNTKTSDWENFYFIDTRPEPSYILLRMYNTSCQYTILISDWFSHSTPITTAWHQAIIHLNGYLHDENKIWQMANAKIEGATPSKILKIKNNPPEPVDIILIPNPDVFLDIKTGSEEFHKHYQNLCDLIYNSLLHIIYTIPEKDKLINSCRSKSKSIFNPNLNSDNDDNKNNGSSSVQNDNKKYDDSNSDSNPKTYIALLDLTKEQELKWFSDNNESSMPECVHDTDTGFDLKYSGKDAIKLEPYLCTCIDLKVALEIPATTIIQLAFRNNLAKKGINIRERIIDTEYIENIIAMLQNNSEKTYVIEPNKKIVQAIFLPLVKIAQLILVRNRKKLGITAKEIQRFGFTRRIDVSVNMAEKEYIVVIEKKVKNQVQIFETEATLCKSEKIGLVNLHIPAKNHSHIKIPIYNNTKDIIEIPEKTTIGYLTTKINEQPPNLISDFPQLCGYVDITSQTIYKREECYLLQLEQLKQINLENLDPFQ